MRYGGVVTLWVRLIRGGQGDGKQMPLNVSSPRHGVTISACTARSLGLVSTSRHISAIYVRSDSSSAAAVKQKKALVT